MFVDGDPKDPTDTEDIELDEEQEETEEPTGDEEPAGDETDEEPEAGDEDDEQEQPEAAAQDDEDDDLPTDPKALRHIVREQQKMLERSQREPAARPSNATDEEPDPLMKEIASVIQDKNIPVSLRRVVYGLTQKLAQTEQEAMLARRDAKKVTQDTVERSIPKSHRAGAKEISEQFGIPLPVAHQLYKAQLYDAAIERARAKKRGAAPPAEAPAPTRKTGSAQHTFTRPVRGGGDGTAGAKTVDIAGVKVPLKFKSPSEYATFMDGLPSDKHRAIVLKARRDGKAALIAS